MNNGKTITERNNITAKAAGDKLENPTTKKLKIVTKIIFSPTKNP